MVHQSYQTLRRAICNHKKEKGQRKDQVKIWNKRSVLTEKLTTPEKKKMTKTRALYKFAWENKISKIIIIIVFSKLKIKFMWEHKTLVIEFDSELLYYQDC